MGNLFLPFTPNGQLIELRAIEVKERLGVGAAVPINPFEVLDRVPAKLVSVNDLWDRDPTCARALFVEYPKQWSGVGFGESPYDGAALILLNPCHASTRLRATLMEELVHIILKHPMSRLMRIHGDVSAWKRSHSAVVEEEAFAVGAACLIPYPAIFHAIRDGSQTAAQIASRFCVSEQCVLFRINTAGLSRMYRKRSLAQASGGVRPRRWVRDP